MACVLVSIMGVVHAGLFRAMLTFVLPVDIVTTLSGWMDGMLGTCMAPPTTLAGAVMAVPRSAYCAQAACEIIANATMAPPVDGALL